VRLTFISYRLLLLQKMLFSYLLACVILCAALSVHAQSDIQAFRNAQMSSSRVSQAWGKYNDTLRKQFEKKGIAYPPKDIFLRTFKAQNELELWARNDEGSEYKLVKSYHICALSGVLGPKRYAGDRQVPEGYYFIEEFNPHSDFLLSMLLNYPNYTDALQSNGQKTGGDIYIHGGCVTIGCMPMTDEGIKELYTICLSAKLNGEANIPVHIYPTRFTKASLSFLGRAYAGDTAKQHFWANLKEGYDYFEKNHKILPVMYTTDGRYAN
jgi:murein L,D-transpeptidase YafK